MKVGAARIPSPDVRFGPPALRSLRGNCASPSWLRWFPRPSQGHGQPRPATRVEVPGKGLGRQTRGRRLAACGTRATLTPAQARSEAQPRAACPPIHRHAARRSLAQRARPLTGTQRGAASRSVPSGSPRLGANPRRQGRHPAAAARNRPPGRRPAGRRPGQVSRARDGRETAKVSTRQRRGGRRGWRRRRRRRAGCSPCRGRPPRPPRCECRPRP